MIKYGSSINLNSGRALALSRHWNLGKGTWYGEENLSIYPLNSQCYNFHPRHKRWARSIAHHLALHWLFHLLPLFSFEMSVCASFGMVETMITSLKINSRCSLLWLARSRMATSPDYPILECSSPLPGRFWMSGMGSVAEHLTGSRELSCSWWILGGMGKGSDMSIAQVRVAITCYSYCPSIVPLDPYAVLRSQRTRLEGYICKLL